MAVVWGDRCFSRPGLCGRNERVCPAGARTANIAQDSPLRTLDQHRQKGQPVAAVRNPLEEPGCYFLRAAVLAAASAYFLVKRSTRPAVSTSFCLPVKKGWQLEQISRLMLPLWVERVVNVFPHAQCTRTSSYLGWIAAFICLWTFRGKALFYLRLADFG